MTKLVRKYHKVFGATATEDKIGQFGSANLNQKIETKDIDEIQALEAWDKGWEAGTIGENRYPSLQERNGVDYEHSYQTGYILQEGIPEWNEQTEYHKGSIVKALVGENIMLYSSTVDSNLGHILNESDYWKEISFGGGGLEIADIGIASLGIDETQNKRRYLNGQLLIQEQFVSFTNKVKKAKELYPNLFCTEEEWQATVTMSTFGQCGKFVIDDEAGTIRLPKITGFIQGLTDLASLGELVEAGLPSISHTHTRGTMNITGSITGNNVTTSLVATSGAFTRTAAGTTRAWHLGDSYAIDIDGKTNFDASRNWTGATSTNSAVPAIYGKSSTVQPEAIRYPYFIQVATGAEESVDVTREIELNNPFFFGYYQYFETAPNNISWLKSEGQWNSKAVYTDYYDWILTNANNGVENFKLSTDTYDDYAWVVNTADETFRLPIKTKNAPFTVNGTANVSVYGNGKTLGLTNGSADYVLAGGVSGHDTRFANYQSNIDSTSGDPGLTVYGRFGVSSDPTKSGLTGKATVSTSENTNVSLYFYVGETTQNANLVNVGRIEETVVNKLNRTGDTMTGMLNVVTGRNGVRLTSNVITLGETPTENHYASYTIYDKNDKFMGEFYYRQGSGGDVYIGMGCRNQADSANQYCLLGYTADGKPMFQFPKCTTKATTTSSANNNLVAVVVQNYVSGTSWYRVWSDGWIEQGGALHSLVDTTSGVKTVTYLKSFSNANYTLVVNIGNNSSDNISYYRHPYAKTNTGFTYNKMNIGIGNWYACGY